MLLYHPYVFGFVFGSALIISFTGLIITSISMIIFTRSKIQYFLVVMDLNMIVQAFLVGNMANSVNTWVMIVVLSPIYSVMFSMYAYLRCYTMMHKTMQYIGLVIYLVTYIAIVFLELGAFNFIENRIGAIFFIAVLPFVAAVAISSLLHIIFLIRSNPMRAINGRQNRLMMISNFTVIFLLLTGTFCGLLTIYSVYFQSSVLWNIAMGLAPLTALVCVLSNFFMTMNRSIEDDYNIPELKVYGALPSTNMS